MEVSRIKISENFELPMKCDLYVLDMIQQEYGTIMNFEKQLAGIKEYGEGEEAKLVRVEPSAGAVAFALPLMVLEGMKIEKEEKEVNYKVNTEKEIISSVTRDFRMIAYDLHEEMKRCFAVKK